VILHFSSRRAPFVSIVVLALFAFVPQPASAALSADELVLICNGNIPVSVKTAEFYAQARLVPPGRIIKLNLPAGEEIPFEKYEAEVVPQVRAFLRDNGLEKKVRCAVTFFGVPIRIGAKRQTDEDTAEAAELRRQLTAIGERALPQIRDVEQIAASLDPSFTPRVGEDPSDLSARADHALQGIARHMPPPGDPRHKDLLLLLSEPLAARQSPGWVDGLYWPSPMGKTGGWTA